MQLVAYGAQDVYLTGNPKVTFFQAVYKRHTNFAMEMIQQTVNGSPASGGRVSVTVARNGDLIGEMYIQLQSNVVPVISGGSVSAGGDSCWLAERAIADIELTIGGQRIDKHYQRWWRLWSELYLDEAKKANYGKMTSNPLGNVYSAGGNNGSISGEVWLPLIFFFNRNPGLYLPLIALQYHEVRLDFDLSNEYSLCFQTTFNVWGNYVYLDTEERRRFAQKGHEYLIEQVQHTGTDTVFSGTATGTSTGAQIRLSYNHPVKELVWALTTGVAAGSAYGKTLWDMSSNAASVNSVFITTDTSNTLAFGNLLNNSYAVSLTYGTGAPVMVAGSQRSTLTEDGAVGAQTTTGQPREVGPLASFRVILNGQDRFKDQSGKYFNQVEPFMHHSGNPYPGIYSYSFALKPEEHQPTGTCNFSRIDNAQVDVRVKTNQLSANGGSTLDMYAVNYNVLRIQSGMGGLAFSN